MCVAVSVVTVDSVACPSETPKYEKVFMTENSLNKVRTSPSLRCRYHQGGTAQAQPT